MGWNSNAPEWFLTQQKANQLLRGKVIKEIYGLADSPTIETTDGVRLVLKFEAKVEVVPNAELFDQNGRVEV